MRSPFLPLLAAAGWLALSAAPALASADREAYWHQREHERWEHYRHERERAREMWREEHRPHCHWVWTGYRSVQACD